MRRDTSRIWVTDFRYIASHHFQRYDFASLGARGRILDAACGCGYGSAFLSADGRDVVGVDQDDQAIDWANKYFSGPTYICGKIEDSPWDGEFDTIVTLETLEHMPEPVNALKTFRKSCRGILIASVPNQIHYPFVASDFANDHSPHFRHYTPHEFEALLNDGGFSVIGRFCQESKFRPEVHPGSDGKFMIYVCE